MVGEGGGEECVVRDDECDVVVGVMECLVGGGCEVRGERGEGVLDSVTVAK